MFSRRLQYEFVVLVSNPSWTSRRTIFHTVCRASPSLRVAAA